MYRQVNNLRGQARVLGNLGMVYKYKGKANEAEEILKESLDINQQVNNFLGQAWISGDMGLLYKEQGELKKSEKFHKMALKINRQLGNLRGQAWTCNNMGTIYIKQNKYSEAKKIYNEALKLNTDNRLDHLPGQAWSCYNLGLLCRYQEEFDKAEELLKRAMDINQLMNHYIGKAKVYCSLGLVYKKKGKHSDADRYSKLAQSAFIKIGYIQDVTLLPQTCIACKNNWDYDNICSDLVIETI